MTRRELMASAAAPLVAPGKALLPTESQEFYRLSVAYELDGKLRSLLWHMDCPQPARGKAYESALLWFRNNARIAGVVDTFGHYHWVRLNDGYCTDRVFVEAERLLRERDGDSMDGRASKVTVCCNIDGKILDSGHAWEMAKLRSHVRSAQA